MSIAEEEVSQANIRTFLGQAQQFRDEGLFFNKPLVLDFDVKEQCIELAKVYLNKDIMFLQSVVETRLYIKDVFGDDLFYLFQDNLGDIILDMEHALLFYYKAKEQNHKNLDIAKGIVFFIAGEQLKNEFGTLAKVTNSKNQIFPKFLQNRNTFSWGQCPFVLRKYMLQLSAQEGYVPYVFERPNLGQILYLTLQGKSFQEARDEVNNMTNGLFYSYLPKEVEELLIPAILSDELDTDGMTGYYKQSYTRDIAQVATDLDKFGKKNMESDLDTTKFNIYTQKVKPLLIELTGMALNNIKNDIAHNINIDKGDVKIYHLSPQRIGIMVKEGVDVEKALPTVHPHISQVEPVDLENILNGAFL